MTFTLQKNGLALQQNEGFHINTDRFQHKKSEQPSQ